MVMATYVGQPRGISKYVCISWIDIKYHKAKHVNVTYKTSGSQMGEGGVIGHGIGGKHIPAKMARLTESQSLE